MGLLRRSRPCGSCPCPSRRRGITDMLQHDNFYLTGSRFFGNFTENSDWDYFTDDERKFYEVITGLKASPIKYGDAFDYITKDVCRFNIGTAMIDIILVKDSNVKLRAQGFIKSMGIFDLHKAVMTRVWNSTYEICELMIKSDGYRVMDFEKSIGIDSPHLERNGMR
jgi:hypothetical protein